MSTANNARFVNMGEGSDGRPYIAEMISYQVQIHYDPTTGKARVSFNGAPYINMGGTYRRIGDSQDILQTELEPYMALCVVPPGIKDPVTQADLSKMSLAGMFIVHKFAYDIFFNIRAGTPGYPMAPTYAGRAPQDEVPDANVSPLLSGP